MTDRVRAGIAGTLGVGILTAMLLVFLFGGTALPLHLGNLGSFVVQTSALEADDFSLRPRIDGDSGTRPGASLPAGFVSIGNVRTLDNLVLQKEFNFGTVVDGLGVWTLAVTSPDVRASGLSLYSPHICAARVDFRGLDVNGITASDPRDTFVLAADSAVLGDVNIESTQLNANSISLPGLQVKMRQGGYAGVGQCLSR